jgi:hypothetical protein
MYLTHQTNWSNQAGARELAAQAKAQALKRAEEEERVRKRKLLGLDDPFDQPFSYPWDDR